MSTIWIWTGPKGKKKKKKKGTDREWRLICAYNRSEAKSEQQNKESKRDYDGTIESMPANRERAFERNVRIFF